MNKQSSASNQFKKILPVILITSALIGTLSGCAPEQTNTSKPTDISTKTSSAVPTKTFTQTPGSTSAPLAGLLTDLTCEKVLSTKALYDLNPNFAYVPDQTPESGSLPAKFKELKGINCQYVNMSGGDTIWLSIAKLAGQGNETVKSGLQTSSTPTAAYGEAPTVYGYYTSANGVGTAQVVTSDYWISAESTWFTSPDDAIGFIRAAVTSIP